jgi:hypothetical protein
MVIVSKVLNESGSISMEVSDKLGHRFIEIEKPTADLVLKYLPYQWLQSEDGYVYASGFIRFHIYVMELDPQVKKDSAKYWRDENLVVGHLRNDPANFNMHLLDYIPASLNAYMKLSFPQTVASGRLRGQATLQRTCIMNNSSHMLIIIYHLMT